MKLVHFSCPKRRLIFNRFPIASFPPKSKNCVSYHTLSLNLKGIFVFLDKVLMLHSNELKEILGF